MTEIILHHFPGSPFAHKARVALGIKGLAWRSVEIPNVMPKPDLTALTGGYRNTPVMQIGADIYCDTQCILRELDDRHPKPPLRPSLTAGTDWLLFAWADRPFYATVNAVMFGVNADKLPDSFVKDREEHRGFTIDLKQFQRDLPQWRRNLAAQLDWLEESLADGRPYLLGEALSVADIGVYGPVWQMAKGDPGHAAQFATFPKLSVWRDRIAAFGIGAPTDMDAAEAVAIAAAASPGEVGGVADRTTGLSEGARVSVTPDDKGKVSVEGTLVDLSSQRIGIRRQDERAGEVIVHFPRAGFQLAAA